MVNVMKLNLTRVSSIYTIFIFNETNLNSPLSHRLFVSNSIKLSKNPHAGLKKCVLYFPQIRSDIPSLKNILSRAFPLKLYYEIVSNIFPPYGPSFLFSCSRPLSIQQEKLPFLAIDSFSLPLDR